MRHTRPSGHHGFTIVELLVVIAIIGVLAAMIFPVFAGAKERGRMTACSSNLRQLVMAVHAYAQDHDDLYPVGATFHNPQRELTRALHPYVQSRHVFYCPSGATANLPELLDVQANWTAGDIGYLYWCYDRYTDTTGWSRWIPRGRRILTGSSDPDSWLFSDWFKRDLPTCHRVTDKTMLYACIDGRVSVVVKHPQAAFR